MKRRNIEMMKTKLNLGCGDDIREDYINIDIRSDINNKTKYDQNVRIQDVTNLDFEKNSIDEILASDIYEHISHLESVNVLKHWNDLLVPDGILIIRSPSLDVIMKYLLEATDIKDIENGIRMIFGGQEYKENSHYTICHTQLMINYLEEANFKNIKYKFDHQNIIIHSQKK